MKNKKGGGPQLGPQLGPQFKSLADPESRKINPDLKNLLKSPQPTKYQEIQQKVQSMEKINDIYGLIPFIETNIIPFVEGIQGPKTLFTPKTLKEELSGKQVEDNIMQEASLSWEQIREKAMKRSYNSCV